MDNNELGIEVLIEKCLIAISCVELWMHDLYKELWMHDLLQEMAKKIVQKASPNELGRRSRLWNKEDVCHVLTNNLGTEAIEGIISDFSEQEEVSLRAKAFSNMKKLRMLQIHNVKLPHGLDYLSNDLRFLKWYKYPLKSLPSSFHPDKIVVLDLCYSHIQQLWKLIKPLNKLKFINLSHSKNLTKMPDFTWIPNLESLILERCTRLLELHPSIGDLKRLIVLNLKDCKSLSSLPSSIKWESLEVCMLAGCSKIEKFPEIIGEMESLKILDVSGTAIRQLPVSFFLSMKNLEVLSFRGCKGAPHKSWRLLSPFQLMQGGSLDPMALRLPSLSVLCCLKKLDLSDCNLREGAILNDLGSLSSLKVLDLSNSNFVSLPTNINQLSNLYTLYLNDCKRLKSLPVLPPNISQIKVSNCTSMEILPDALKSLPVQNTVRNSFIGFNCLKLVENEGGSKLAFAMIKRSLLQGQRYYDIVIPGNEIPKWFSHHGEGASTSLEGTALFDRKIVGVVVCCVFIFHKLPRIHENDTLMSFDLGSSNPMIGCYFPTDYVWKPVNDNLREAHLWLQVIPDRAQQVRSINKSQLIFSFEHKCPGVEVKKFGIRLIHKHEVEELNQTINQCSSSTIQNLNQDLDISTLDDARIKKLHDKRSESGTRERKFAISITNSGVVWEDL